MGFCFTWLIFGAWCSDSYTPEKLWPTLFFLHIFFLVYTAAPFFYRFFRPGGAVVADLALIALTSFISMSYCASLVTDRSGDSRWVMVLAVPALFSARWATVFWAIQAAALLWAAYRLDHRALAAGASLLLLMALCKLAYVDYAATFGFDEVGLVWRFRHGC